MAWIEGGWRNRLMVRICNQPHATGKSYQSGLLIVRWNSNCRLGLTNSAARSYDLGCIRCRSCRRNRRNQSGMIQDKFWSDISRYFPLFDRRHDFGRKTQISQTIWLSEPYTVSEQLLSNTNREAAQLSQSVFRRSFSCKKYEQPRGNNILFSFYWQEPPRRNSIQNPQVKPLLADAWI
jgi:hypothetical protein